MKVTIYGAGGPVAAAAIAALDGRHELLLTDLRPIETTHPFRQVDITDFDSVREAAHGRDVLINCTVNRPDPVLAFDVNVRGAYNVACAAVAEGVPRIIHTGPAATLSSQSGYNQDLRVSENVPARPGVGLYAITKHLAQEILGIFCRRHPELCCISFVYSGFFSEEPEGRGWVPDFGVHAEDAGQAFLLGVEVPRERLPSNDELFFISADLPFGRVSVDKARKLLGWEPQHNFEHLWRRSAKRQWEARKQAQSE